MSNDKEQTVERERDSWKREATIYRDALVVAINALEQNVTICRRAWNAGIPDAGPLVVMNEQALKQANRALAPWAEA